jgi:pimeloyl-ACP methyl ester carboxylesterase
MGRLRSRVRRIVAIDYPGHGRSEDPSAPMTSDILFDATSTLLADLVREPAVFVGNSLGGAVAVNHAVARPDRVRGLILLSPAGAPSTPRELDELRASFAITSRRQAMELIDRVHHRAPFLARLVAHEIPSTRRPAVAELLASISTATVDDSVIATAVGTLAMPTLLWWGRSERLLPASHLAWWRSHLPPHAVIEEPHGIGHCPHLDDPTRLASRITSFATELDATALAAGARPTRVVVA